jgi:hypothetical protein
MTCLGQRAGISPEQRRTICLRMRLLKRLTARRRQKAHERYLQERERQRLLSEMDTEQTIRDVATNWNVAGQGTSGTGPAP